MTRHDSEEVANRISRRAKQAAEHAVKASEIFSPDAQLEGDELLAYSKRAMWAEFYFGCFPPAKQMDQVYELNDQDPLQNTVIIQELTNQIRDELKHAKQFSNRLEELGGNPNLKDHQPSQETLDLFNFTHQLDHPAAIAAAQQLGGEEFVIPVYEAMIEYDMVDDRTKEVMHTQIIDEPNHHNVGRKLIVEFATDEETRQQVEEANTRAIELMYRRYGLEYDPKEIG